MHQSNLAFVGFNYGSGERFLPELRLSTDVLLENTSLELAKNYIYYRDKVADAYAGIGGRVLVVQSIAVPAGINIYPFENKNFGLQIELSTIIANNEGKAVLRGSWGLRYRFMKSE